MVSRQNSQSAIDFAWHSPYNKGVKQTNLFGAKLMKTLISNAAHIEASVTYGPSKSAKCRDVTTCNIMVADAVIATGTFGGKFSQEQAVKEFKRAPHRFMKTDMYAVAVGLGIVG